MDPLLLVLVVLVALWAGGVADGVGPGVHLLAIVAVLILLLRVVQGRRR